MSPVRIGRLQQKCISICYSKKKKDLFLSVRFCLEGAKIAESEERDYLQSREKEKKLKRQYLFQEKKILDEKTLLDPVAPAKSCGFS